MKKLLLALLACILVSAMVFMTGCGNNEEELEALRQEKEQLQEQHTQELQDQEQGLQEQIQELQGEMEALLREVEALEEKLEEPEEPEEPEVADEDGSELVGAWEVLLFSLDFFNSMMDEGWLFEEEFFEDGTGMSWWFDPDEEEWVEVLNWDWSAEDGQLTQTVIWMNEEILEAVFGPEAVEILADGIGDPETVPYMIEEGVILVVGELGEETFLRRL